MINLFNKKNLSFVILVLVFASFIVYRAHFVPGKLPAPPVKSSEKRPERMYARTEVDPFAEMSNMAGFLKNPPAGYDAMSFSNTMEWGAIPARYAREPALGVFRGWEKIIQIPPPPANSSLRTQKELELLREYQKLRTPERVEQIKKEAELDTLEFVGHMYLDYADPRKFPLTSKIVAPAFNDLLKVFFAEKKKFDRVRPSMLEPALDPVLPVPGHPAYPSGHATQAFFLAYLLSELAPERRAEFETRALEIAVDREIASLHYPSDTHAGALLARQLVDMLTNQKEFRDQLEAAKTEWMTK